MTAFIDIAALEDIPRQGARVVKTPAGCIAIFRTADDQVFALDDRCPHKGGPLSEGIVHGTSVTCPLHAAVFDLTTGQGTDDWRVKTHAVRVDGGRVLLEAAFLARRSAA
ncbi:MAG TPA: nitrite reductase small subunit NirD [Paracoccaceae bacterium]|nr:nitrite reductase small subunit NirD [Paracoccaceae bacterium]